MPRRPHPGLGNLFSGRSSDRGSMRPRNRCSVESNSATALPCQSGASGRRAAADAPPDDGPPQMSLFDSQDLAEIVHPDYPGERLFACRNPALATEHARKRDDLRAAAETLRAKVKSRVKGRHTARTPDGTLTGSRSARSSTGTGWPNTFTLHIGPTSLTFGVRLLNHQSLRSKGNGTRRSHRHCPIRRLTPLVTKA